MRDFPFWRGAIYNAKTALDLRAIEEDIGNFQLEPVSNFREPKLTSAQVEILRKLVIEKMAELLKPEFNK